MKNPWNLSSTAMILVACASVTPSQADTVERLIMPGPVIRAHAEYEKDCRKCHARFSKQEQASLCVACHEEIGDDVTREEGHHGRIGDIAGDCKRCHTEHKGRAFDIVALDPETFDHDVTDFSLEGAHVRLGCSSCHKAGTRHRETATACHVCHAADDIHRAAMGEDCATCHVATAWSGAGFDHDETAFRLELSHRDTACSSCHPDQHYSGTPQACSACHRLDDIHGGRYGRECATCHAPSSWDAIDFDHSRDTGYALTGKHASVRCEACHGDDLYAETRGTACNDCHAADDRHNGRNGSDCTRCHGTASWSQVGFDHDRDTDFPLNGAHTRVSCRACHRGRLGEETLETECYACHEHTDPHDGAQGRTCDGCHGETTWATDVEFDHDTSRFPLIGLHVLASCEQCHLTRAYSDASHRCAGCHAADDMHGGRLTADCGRCHNPNGWLVWRFDHELDTDFALEGAHIGLVCETCHTQPDVSEIDLATNCLACHRNDDVHNGGFGRFCDRCHGTDSFVDLRMR